MNRSSATRSRSVLERLLVLATIVVPCVALLHCGDSKSSPSPTATGTATTPAPTTTGVTDPDAGPDAARRTSCLDRPTDVPRPSDRLPCELIPPGLTL